MNQLKYVEDDNHKSHLPRQFVKFSVHHIHSQYLPRHQSKRARPVQVNGQQFSALPAVFLNILPDDQSCVRAAYYIDIITPCLNILFINKTV